MGRSGCEPSSPTAEQAGCSVWGRCLPGSGERVPGAIAWGRQVLCTHTWGESSTRVKSPKVHLDTLHHAVVCNGHLTPQSDIPKEQKGLAVKHHCLSHLQCYDKKNLHLQIFNFIKLFYSNNIFLRFQASDLYFCCSKGAVQ